MLVSKDMVVFNSEESDDLIRDLLLLVDEDISLEVIGAWTEDEKWKACVWAGRVHSCASHEPSNTRPAPVRPNFLPIKDNPCQTST
jgi:hypothetical protein